MLLFRKPKRQCLLISIISLIFVSSLGHYLIFSPVLALSLCVSLCASRDHQIVPKSHWTAILCFVFWCFWFSLCFSIPDHQIVPKSHWTAINTWRNPRNRPTPICQLQIRYSLPGKCDTQFDAVSLGRNSGLNEGWCSTRARARM